MRKTGGKNEKDEEVYGTSDSHHNDGVKYSHSFCKYT